MRIASVFVDSGYLTDMVYEYTAPRWRRRVYATKGMDGPGRAVAAAPRIVKRKGKPPVRLVILGVDSAKQIVANRVKATPGPGYTHFNKQFDEEYFAQLAGEKKIQRYVRGFPIAAWVKTRPRNEALDLRVLSLGAMKLLGPRWDELEVRTKVVAEATAANERPPPPPRQPRRRVRSKGIT